MLFERADALMRTSRTRLSDFYQEEVAILNELLSQVGAGWADRVRLSGVSSEGAVRYLLVEGATSVDIAPVRAHEVLTAAAGMAASLVDTPQELRAAMMASSLTVRANALRHLGRHDAAIADLTSAAEAFDAARYCADEAGKVGYTRATVLFKKEQWQNALVAVREARQRFKTANNPRRRAHADILESCILFEQGNLESARKTLLRVRATLEAIGDHEGLARVWLNRGVCDIRRGDAQTARHWLNRASAAFRARGSVTELARTLWNMATFLATFRNRRYGMCALWRAARKFSGLQMHADSASVQLDILELMIEDDAPSNDLRTVANNIIADFSRAGLDVSTAAALDQLKRAQGAHAGRDAIREVRVWLRQMESYSCSAMDAAGDSEAGDIPDL